MLKIIIFNVERGFCSFIRSPNKYALLIDCGNSAIFSPIKYIIDHEIEHVKDFEGYKLVEFVCTHPHEDHISDIERLKKILKPNIIYGRRFDPWDEIKNPEDKREEAYLNLDIYAEFRDTYTEPIKTRPDWGMELWGDGLSIAEAKKINSERQAFTNNSSITLMLKYKGRKLFFPGDLMEDGWEKLLEGEDFKKALKGTDFFITSHHGHKSGYHSKIYEVMGEDKPLINIVSEKSGEEVYSVYSDSEHAKGIEWNSETRRMFSTRRGSIFITISDDGSFNIDQKKLEDNISQ